MVSLFTTATTSSATPNDARRAYNLAESGTRYAFSQLRDSDFDSNEINTLNSTTYTVNQAGTFSLNVFGPWFDSNSDYKIYSNGQVTINIAEGLIPDDFSTLPNAFLFNFLNFGPSVPDHISAVVGSVSNQTATSIAINVSDSFFADIGDRICIAVKPSSAQTVNKSTPTDIVSLSVDAKAWSIFPKRFGAISVNYLNNDYFYSKMVYHDEVPARVELINLTKRGSDTFTLSIDPATDFVILSDINYTIIAEGQSGDVIYGGDLDSSANIYKPLLPLDRKPDIDFEEEGNLPAILAQRELNPDLFAVDNTDKTITIGGGSEASFGSVWYSGTKSIGGTNFCSGGPCQFREGVRVFFTLKYSGNGDDGFTFTIMNATNNTITSVGGDIDLPELLGYAGDSRKVTNPVGALDFLDNTDTGEGIKLPKLAVEFDTLRNTGTPEYCAGPNPTDDVNVNTRNDPLSSEKDAVQYVFWGDRNLDIPCRGNKATYDDNRHDATVDPITDPKNYKDNTSIDPAGRFLVAVNNTPEAIEPEIRNSLPPGAENDWLNSGPWAIRIEVMRNTLETNEGEYILRTWIRQCQFDDCRNIMGTFFQDTRIEFDISEITPHLVQTFTLNPTDNSQFDTFIFGFTSAIASGASQSAVIDNFQLSFIRLNDPVKP